MKLILLSLILVLISGCSNIYSDIEVEFGSKEKPAESNRLDTKTFSVSSQKRKGIETYRNIATILISEKGIFLDAGAPFTESVFIPTLEIAGCAMTCFGTEDQHVDFLILKTGTDLMIQSTSHLKINEAK